MIAHDILGAPEYPECTDTQYRLPTDLKPSHYDVEIKADIYQPDPEDFNLEGWVTMHLDCQESTETIVFHKGVRIDIDTASIVVRNSVSNEAIGLSGLSEDVEKNFYKVHLSRVLSVGENITVSLHYTSPMKNDLSGFFWFNYVEDGETR